MCVRVEINVGNRKGKTSRGEMRTGGKKLTS